MKILSSQSRHHSTVPCSLYSYDKMQLNPACYYCSSGLVLTLELAMFFHLHYIISLFSIYSEIIFPVSVLTLPNSLHISPWFLTRYYHKCPSILLIHSLLHPSLPTWRIFKSMFSLMLIHLLVNEQDTLSQNLVTDLNQSLQDDKGFRILETIIFWLVQVIDKSQEWIIYIWLYTGKKNEGEKGVCFSQTVYCIWYFRRYAHTLSVCLLLLLHL